MQIGANYKDSVIASGFPDIRWHQTADYGYVPNPKMKNVFMAVSMDITDFNSPFGRQVQLDFCSFVVLLEIKRLCHLFGQLNLYLFVC